MLYYKDSAEADQFLFITREPLVTKSRFDELHTFMYQLECAIDSTRSTVNRLIEMSKNSLSNNELNNLEEFLRFNPLKWSTESKPRIFSTVEKLLLASHKLNLLEAEFNSINRILDTLTFASEDILHRLLTKVSVGIHVADLDLNASLDRSHLLRFRLCSCCHSEVVELPFLRNLSEHHDSPSLMRTGYLRSLCGFCRETEEHTRLSINIDCIGKSAKRSAEERLIFKYNSGIYATDQYLPVADIMSFYKKHTLDEDTTFWKTISIRLFGAHKNIVYSSSNPLLVGNYVTPTLSCKLISLDDGTLGKCLPDAKRFHICSNRITKSIYLHTSTL